jgi:3-methyladenine DNA glycosylase/8-oxoguanine DNA glycosylase
VPTLSIEPPSDYVLRRDACSYGYFLLEPNRWEPEAQALTTTVDLGGTAVSVRVTQPGRARRGGRLRIETDAALARPERERLRASLTRMLRLDEPAATVRAFHALDPRFARSGRGRLMRSASLFEDVIKTVTSCNVTWPSTVGMNRKLCAVYGRASASGRRAFPTQQTLARVRPASLRARCSVGYRDARIVELAGMFARGEIDGARLECPRTPASEKYDAMLEWPGIGPYAAANILQLLGCYERLPLDTESVRHGRDVLGFKGTASAIMKRVHRHFEPFGEHRFRSYWFELWEHYEARRGPAHTWDRDTTGTTFTAAQLRKDLAIVREAAGRRRVVRAGKAP